MDISYYDKFSKVYDWLSPKWYYHNACNYAIQQLQLKQWQTVLIGNIVMYFYFYFSFS